MRRDLERIPRKLSQAEPSWEGILTRRGQQRCWGTANQASPAPSSSCWGLPWPWGSEVPRRRVVLPRTSLCVAGSLGLLSVIYNPRGHETVKDTRLHSDSLQCAKQPRGHRGLSCLSQIFSQEQVPEPGLDRLPSVRLMIQRVSIGVGSQTPPQGSVPGLGERTLISGHQGCRARRGKGSDGLSTRQCRAPRPRLRKDSFIQFSPYSYEEGPTAVPFRR